MANRLPRIYLAGKISKNDWRCCHVSYAEDALNLDHDEESYFSPPFTITGPFFISCDHGCSHGPHTHGLTEGCGTGVDKYPTRDEVWRLNTQRILRSDAVFAWIDEQDCFGTLSEIGWASGRRKIVGVGFGSSLTVEQRKDFWFVERFGQVVYDGMSVENALALFVDRCGKSLSL